jgi:glycosyltransferase involved in cell wall biosynthesis
MKVSLVVPYIDQLDKVALCLQTAHKNAGAGYELVTINNGSEVPLSSALVDNNENVFINNEVNLGVLPTFKQGYENATGDIILFIHSDVLIHETDWVPKLQGIFEQLPDLGLGGFLGARGIGENGGRIDVSSNLRGEVWGGCDCHDIAAKHHGELIEVVTPATVVDGLGMAFRRETLQRLVDETDVFADWRAPHHFYDKILSLKVIQLGYKVATIPFACDHYSGATANHSQIYQDTMKKWLADHGNEVTDNADDGIYHLAEQQMFNEYREMLPITVGADWSYFSKGTKL